MGEQQHMFDYVHILIWNIYIFEQKNNISCKIRWDRKYPPISYLQALILQYFDRPSCIWYHSVPRYSDHLSIIIESKCTWLYNTWYVCSLYFIFHPHQRVNCYRYMHTCLMEDCCCSCCFCRIVLSAFSSTNKSVPGHCSCMVRGPIWPVGPRFMMYICIYVQQLRDVRCEVDYEWHWRLLIVVSWAAKVNQPNQLNQLLITNFFK